MAHWGEITPKGCLGVQREYSAICWDADNIGTDGRLAVKGTAINNCSALKAKYGDPGKVPPPQVSAESVPSKAEWLGSSIWGSWYVNDVACGYVAPVVTPPVVTPPVVTPPPAAGATTPSGTTTPPATGTPATGTTTPPATGTGTTGTGTTNGSTPATKEPDYTWVYILVAAVFVVIIIIIVIVVVVSRSKKSGSNVYYGPPPPQQQYY